jgi:signal transduction histidine kinase
MNIAANAIDALEMRDISPGNSQPAKEITISTSQVDSGHICVKIADNAGGIPADIQAKIFDHFFTTKAPGKGTGLGLAISDQIFEKPQGKIEVNSLLDQSSEFVITLPISFAQKSDC